MEQPSPQQQQQQQGSSSSTQEEEEGEEEEPKEEEEEKCNLLLLFLGLSQQSGGDENTTTCSTSAHCRLNGGAHWDFLTLRDLANCRCASKSIYCQLQFVEYTKCRDGRDYLVPFPGYPGLLSTPNDINTTDNDDGSNNGNYAGLFAHQLASLRAMHVAENSSRHFGALRGGILGDAPGLGKTITMLALIASTAGMRPIAPPEFWNTSSNTSSNDDDDADWRAFCQNPTSTSEILVALKPIRWHLRDDGWLKELQAKMASGHFPTLRSFEKHVRGLFSSHNRVANSDRRHGHYYSRCLELLQLFSHNLVKIKAGLDKRNRKLLSNATGRRLLWERLLVPTSATLIIVPNALLEHWFQQVHLHLHLSIFCDDTGNHENERATVQEGGDNGNNNNNGTRTATTAPPPPPPPRGVVYLDGVGDLADVLQQQGGSLSNIISLQNHATLANSWELSRYLMVITTFSRCQSEFAREVAAGRMVKNNSSLHQKKRRLDAVDCSRDGSGGGGGTTSSSPSPLLQMRWLRIVVDEGHELGIHDDNDNETQHGVTRFINEMAAERRWVLSGTPTVGDEDDINYTSHALDQLQRLLFFLRHPEYGINISESNNNGGGGGGGGDKKAAAQSAWLKRVKRPFLDRKPKGRQHLLDVLKQIMVMHRKEDIELPKPIFRQVECYATIPAQVQDKLAQSCLSDEHLRLALDQYLHSEEYQSVVDQTQADYIVKAIRKAQQSLRNRGGPLLQAAGQIQQTATAMVGYHSSDPEKDFRPIKAVVYSIKHNILLSVTEQLIRKLGPENIAEVYEESKSIGDISSELARFRHGCRKYRACPVCKRENDVRSKGRPGDFCQATLMEVLLTSTTPPVRFLIEPERITRTYNVHIDRLQGEPLSKYSKHPKFWRVGDLLHVDVRDPHPFLAKRSSEYHWNVMGAENCRKLAREDSYRGQDWYFGSLPHGEDGGYYLDVTLVKWQKCGKYHNHARWYKGPRLSAAPVEQVQEDVFLLSLDAGLSHGLDLSFVTHLFLLEPIDDAALLEQVTSRAHRLGATGPVVVETVNTFYNFGVTLHSDRFQALIDAKTVKQDRESALSKIVCQHCYRQFKSKAKAEEHEEKLCSRNPTSTTTIDQFLLSSVYREIRPPPLAIDATTDDE